ncbi:MAG TPA: 3,4-dihydroxy-2-butanone-4-phosphate synthase [Methanocella sp.]|nr:3,4-dihydroxy-2-butanone-4-phosphate synthase [Methanocella sp.]
MIDDAVRALRQGKVICLYDYDNRERETDLVFAAEFSTPQLVFQLRRDAGGLMCVALDPVACDRLGIPYITDVLRYAGSCGNGFGAIESIYEKAGDIPYDTKSSFSLWVNHRNVFTGITDVDRSLTIKELAAITDSALDGNKIPFGSRFRSPGHVPLLRCAPRLLQDRRGQTELSIVLARAAGVTPAMVMCEMLDGQTGKALSKEDARNYAENNGLAFVEGKEVEALFATMKK